MLETILTSLEEGILTVTINRPDKLNALNKTVFQELDNVMDEVYQDDTIKAVIITLYSSIVFVCTQLYIMKYSLSSIVYSQE